MNDRTLRIIRAGLMAAAMLAMAAIAAAGLPQPGILLYGQVKQGGNVLTQGTLEWTYTPVAGGAPVKVLAPLNSLPGPNNVIYSYSILIPVDLRIQGYGLDPKALGLYTDRQNEFIRSAKLNGEALSINDSVLGEKFFLNALNHVGYVERVDLLVPGAGDCCPGDADLNKFVNIDDYRAVRDNFGDSTPELGDADCNGFVNMKDYAAVRDNFGKQCAPQSGAALQPAAPGGDDREKAVLPEGATADAATLAVTAASQVARVGEAVDVTLTLNPGSHQAGLAGVFVTFDSQRLTYVAGSVNRDAFDSALFTGVPQEVAPGLIAFSAGSDAGVSESVVLASLLFEAIGAGDAVIGYAAQYPAVSQVQDLSFNNVATQTAGQTIVIETEGVAPSGISDFMLF